MKCSNKFSNFKAKVKKMYGCFFYAVYDWPHAGCKGTYIWLSVVPLAVVFPGLSYNTVSHRYWLLIPIWRIFGSLPCFL